MIAHALYRNRTLLEFPNAQARDTYLSVYMKWAAWPITQGEAAKFQARWPEAKTVAIWQAEPGRWRIKARKSVERLTKEAV